MKFNRFEYESVVDGLKDWYLFHDAGAGTDCVVILHGHGSHGDQLLIRPDLAPWLASLDRFGVSVVSPNLRDNAWMSPAAVSDLSRLLEEGKTRHRWRRIVFASGSMGGTGALIFAVRCPDLADALVILGAATDIGRYCNWCAGQTKPVLKEIHDAIRSVYEGEDYPLHNVCVHAASLTMPVWLYYGGADRTIPVSEARALAEILAGKEDFHYHEIAGGDHDSPLSFFQQGLEEFFTSPGERSK